MCHPSHRARARALLLVASLLVASLLGPLVARAQDVPPADTTAADTTRVAPGAALPTYPADPVVVTASRDPERLRETGRRVTVVTQGTLWQQPAFSYDEALQALGGVDALTRGAFGVQSDLRLRGSSFNGVVVLLDGVRFNDPMSGHFLADLPVPMSEIARVEVLRGPAAATYGPDAMGGVVHLITRTAVRERLRPEATGEAAEGQTTRGRVGGVYGDYGTYDLHGSLRHAEGRTTASAAFARQASRGAPVFGDSTALRYDDGSRLRLDFARTVGTAAVHRRLRRLGGASVYARLGVDDRDFSAYRFYSDFASDRAREATSTGWLHLRLAGPAGGRTRWRVQGAGRVHRDRYRFTPTARANEHVSALGSWQGQVAHDLGARLTLTGGGAVRLRGIDSNNMGVHDDLSGGAFAQGRWRPTQALTLSGSARATYDPYFGLEVTPQLFGAYLASSRVTVRGGIGRAVRAPTYVELFFNQFTKTPSGPNRGNANLVAERAWSAEAGVDVAAARGVMLHATAFGRRTHDLIDYATLSGTESLFRARNLHTVTTRGLELEAVLDRPVLGALVADPADRPALRLALAYTGLDATLEPEAGATPADSIDYKYALTNARHLVQATATVRVRRLRVGVQGLWRENLEAAAAGSQRYGVVHARMRYGFGRIRQTPLIVTAEMRNVFDTAYATPLGTPLPARTLLVGLELVL